MLADATFGIGAGLEMCTGRAARGPGRAEKFLEKNGPGPELAGPGRAANFRPAEARFVKM